MLERALPTFDPGPPTTAPGGNSNGGGGDLPFARDLFAAADQLRGSVESAEYKHLVLGLIFLKYISDSFERQRDRLDAWTRDPANDDSSPKTRTSARRSSKTATSTSPRTSSGCPRGALGRAARRRRASPTSGSASTRRSRRSSAKTRTSCAACCRASTPGLRFSPTKLGELVKTIARVGFGDDEETARDVLGRTYEYFIKTFAKAEGHRGGEFYTPASRDPAPGRDAGALRGPGVRPGMRLVRPVRPEREVRRGSRWPYPRHLGSTARRRTRRRGASDG